MEKELDFAMVLGTSDRSSGCFTAACTKSPGKPSGEEADRKGFVWAEVERGRAQWEFVEVDARPFVTLRCDVKRKGDPTRVVLDTIRKHDVAEAVVRVIISADPESEALLNDRAINHALREAGADHVAAIQRNVERPARMRLGETPEGLTPEELLDRYLAAKAVPGDRVEVLVEHARTIFDGAPREG